MIRIIIQTIMIEAQIRPEAPKFSAKITIIIITTSSTLECLIVYKNMKIHTLKMPVKMKLLRVWGGVGVLGQLGPGQTRGGTSKILIFPKPLPFQLAKKSQRRSSF